MEELEKTFIEEFEGGLEELDKGRYKNATILLSKAMFALCDVLLYNKLRKLPMNHGERFRLLESYFPETYKVVDASFEHYTDAYAKPALKETCKVIFDGIKTISNSNTIPESVRATLKRQESR